MVYFRLPDDFSGSLSDALRCMADYHDHPKSEVVHYPPPQLSTKLSDTLGETFDEFIGAVRDGKRLSGLMQMKDFDPKVEIADL